MADLKIGVPIHSGFLESELHRKDGSTITLAQLLDSRSTLIIFIRHFGCIGCSAHMAELAPRIGEMCELGLNIIIIGNGQPLFVESFMERYRLAENQVTVVTDPTLQIHKQAQLRRSFLATFGPRAVWQVIRAYFKGHAQGAVQGDNFQQGGTLLLSEDRKLKFFHQDQSLGDFANTSAIVDSIYGLLTPKNVLYQ